MTKPATTMWDAGKQDAAQMRDLMALALGRSGVAAILMKGGGEFLFVANLPDCWTLGRRKHPTCGAVFGAEIGERLREMSAATLADREVSSFEIAGPAERRFEFVLDVAGADSPDLLLLTIVELTEEYRREQRLRALLRELSHRSKNLLAIILGVATQTARSAPSLGDFLHRFRGRVYSISHSQDLITDANWHGARLRDLVRSQADKYHERPQDTLTFVGVDPLLSPNEALHVGLAIHELFVDAIALGEASVAFPVITVSCEEKPYAGEPGLEIMWLQANPPVVTGGEIVAAKVDGFHSTVLNRIAPTAIGGKASYEDTRAGPRYRLHFPQSE